MGDVTSILVVVVIVVEVVIDVVEVVGGKMSKKGRSWGLLLCLGITGQPPLQFPKWEV